METSINISQKGFSIVELLVVVTIVTVLSATSLFTIRRAHLDFQRQNLAKDFKVLLDRARYDSIKRRAVTAASRAKVRINNTRNISIQSDLNQDGTLDTSEVREVNFGGTDSGRFITSNTNFPMTITYDQNGYVTATDSTGTTIPLTFSICNYSCTTTTTSSTGSTGTTTTINQNNAQNTSIITISATGTSTILRGTETLASTANPTQAGQTSSHLLNDLLIVSQQYQY